MTGDSAFGKLARMAGLVWDGGGEWRFEEQQQQEDQPAPGAEASSRSKRNRSKKARKTNSTTKIKWGMVEQHYFTPTLGHSVVPAKGTYPLSLGDELTSLLTVQSVDEYSIVREQELLQRTQEKGLPLPSPSPVPASRAPPPPAAAAVPIPIGPGPGAGAATGTGTGTGTEQNLRLETRQYDYKRGVSNPLFAPLNEEERRLILTSQQQNETGGGGGGGGGGKSTLVVSTPPRRSITDGPTSSSSSSCTPPKSSNPRGFNGSPARVGSAGTGQGQGQGQGQGHNSFLLKAMAPASASASLCHAADESLSPHVIAELNKELKAIQRSRDEGVGCSCKPVKVDKLSVGKMRAELLLLSTTLSKESVEALPKAELVAALKDALRGSALCQDGCECKNLGVPCSAEVCACLRKVHAETTFSTAPSSASAPTSSATGTEATAASLSASSLSAAAVAVPRGQLCGNPAGRLVFDQEAVHVYRRRILLEQQEG